MHFFDISTSKSGPRMVCFVHFHLEMCFAPQRRALFRHRNFQKWSGPGVFCTFLLGNVLRATMACNFSSLIWPAGSAPAALASYFSTLRSPKSLEKHSVSRLSYLFAHLHLLSSDSFSSTLLSSNLSLLSSLLCFSSVHIVGSLTSKLPSIREACTSYSPVLLCTTKLAQTTSQYYFLLQSVHKELPSTTVYYKACTKHFPVLLCTTKLAQGTSQCYCVLSLHKALPSTTLYYKACTKHFPVLLCTTKIEQITSQYFFVLQSLHKTQNTLQYCLVLQSLHKTLPSATLHYNAYTNYSPVLLCTTKLAQTTSQYYFILQSFHKALPSTILYYNA